MTNKKNCFDCVKKSRCNWSHWNTRCGELALGKFGQMKETISRIIGDVATVSYDCNCSTCKRGETLRVAVYYANYPRSGEIVGVEHFYSDEPDSRIFARLLDMPQRNSYSWREHGENLTADLELLQTFTQNIQEIRKSKCQICQK